MNYAEDRLDRRSRHECDSSSGGLVADWHEGFGNLPSAQGHELLGRTLRDVGKCRHAAFHYGMAWICNPNSYKAAGDYAQMAELAGFPQVGVLALLHYRDSGELLREEAFVRTKVEMSPPTKDLFSDDVNDNDCGCGSMECGQSMCFVPMVGSESVVEALTRYTQQCHDGRHTCMPTAHEVLGSLSNRNKRETPQLLFKSVGDIEDLLQFWGTKSAENKALRSLEPVLQLLLAKLLYVTIPHLAAEAVVHLQFDHARQLANAYKSHWAYYVLVRAAVLGERIKLHRRRQLQEDETYHIPVWDLLWNKDRRNNEEYTSQGVGTTKIDIKRSLNGTVQYLRSNGKTLSARPATWWQFESGFKPLFVVGDSHVFSVAWQTILVPAPRIAVPVVTTGLKAWHTRSNTRFFTHYLLQTSLDRLPCDCRTILLSAGEIDCREGIGGEHLEGYVEQCHDQVCRTVSEYVHALLRISQDRHIQILVLPVAPHAHRSEKNGKSMGRAFRRQTMQTWNQQLKKELDDECDGGVYFLDYQDRLREQNSNEYVLKEVFNADYTHMNSAFLPRLEKAILESGCDLSLL